MVDDRHPLEVAERGDVHRYTCHWAVTAAKTAVSVSDILILLFMLIVYCELLVSGRYCVTLVHCVI